MCNEPMKEGRRLVITENNKGQEMKMTNDMKMEITCPWCRCSKPKK